MYYSPENMMDVRIFWRHLPRGCPANRSGKPLAIQAIYIMIYDEDRGGFLTDHTLLREGKGPVMLVYFYVVIFHICILYSPGPVLAVLVHRMGILSNPLKNGLIQNTSKINFVFLEKFSVIPEV